MESGALGDLLDPRAFMLPEDGSAPSFFPAHLFSQAAAGQQNYSSEEEEEDEDEYHTLTEYANRVVDQKHHKFDDMDDDDDDDLYDDLLQAHQQHHPSRELMPEHNKLNQLNHFLGIDSLPVHDKCHLIFEKILEELNESVTKHIQMQDFERHLQQSETAITEGQAEIKKLTTENRALEREVNGARFKFLELKSEQDKLRDEEQNIGQLQIRPEELQQLMSKDKPEKLGEKVQILVKKLKFVRTYKEQELKEKKVKMAQKRQILMDEGSELISVQQMKDEINHYRERYHMEKQTAETRQRELDGMEQKGATLRRTLEHDEGKLLQLKVMIDKEREVLQSQAKSRYWQLAQTEDAQAEVDALMDEKQGLVRKKRDLREQVQQLEDKQREIVGSGKGGAAGKNGGLAGNKRAKK
ncbi:hypothetical protein FGO68_gene14713 [Halteria grandinella]|uniref:DUF4201 domain-containing protein n=1 Tax=Halteria grandinella TaxID=5974 RepID=A0A8J8NQI6_HALGN|nr:hypothetical protein FGO68_gene14713 [Halteria grandinella]